MYRNKTKGFTLIELLVVIAIIAILSTVVMAGLNSARQKGRDASRVASIKNLQAALDLFSDTCGSGYPNNGTAIVPGTGTWGDSAAAAGNCVNTANMSTFMPTNPVNPGPGGTAYSYCSTGTAAATGATFAAPACNTAAGARDAYGVTFTLEGANGSLAAGGHIAIPSGIK